MTRFKTIAFAAISSVALAACGGGSSGASRDAAWAVGSSTLYPFAAAVAEEVAKGGVKAPKVEQNGSGAGIKLFCAGVGAAHPDIANASRRMKKSEFEDCQKNGVKDVVEINIGFDGLTVAQSKQGTPVKLSLAQLLLAVAKEVPGPDGKPKFQPGLLEKGEMGRDDVELFILKARVVAGWVEPQALEDALAARAAALVAEEAELDGAGPQAEPDARARGDERWRHDAQGGSRRLHQGRPDRPGGGGTDHPRGRGQLRQHSAALLRRRQARSRRDHDGHRRCRQASGLRGSRAGQRNRGVHVHQHLDGHLNDRDGRAGAGGGHDEHHHLRHRDVAVGHPHDDGHHDAVPPDHHHGGTAGHHDDGGPGSLIRTSPR